MDVLFCHIPPLLRLLSALVLLVLPASAGPTVGGERDLPAWSAPSDRWLTIGQWLSDRPATPESVPESTNEAHVAPNPISWLSQPTPDPHAPLYGTVTGSSAWMLGGVLLVCLGAGLLSRIRWPGVHARGSSARRLQVLDTLPLGPRGAVLLVRCDDRLALLGCDTHGVKTIGFVPPDFADELQTPAPEEPHSAPDEPQTISPVRRPLIELPSGLRSPRTPLAPTPAGTA
jgi:flagellar biogenesis protein FliO